MNILILLLILHNRLTNGFDKTNYCKSKDTTCYGHYDSDYRYSKTCEKTKCSNINSYQCTNDICAEKKVYCDILLNLRFLLATDYFPQIQNINVLESLTENIENCPSYDYTPQSSEICLNGQNCFYRIFPERIKKVICPCIGDLNFRCGKNYCTNHSNSCKTLIGKKLNKKIQFNKCGNDYKIFVNNILLLKKLIKIF